MNAGIQILIERMKTNPEEFHSPQHEGSVKWGVIVDTYWEFFSEEDKAAYMQARDARLQDEFTEVVMKKLAGVGDEDGVVASHNDVNPVTNKIRMQGGHISNLADPNLMYDLNPYQGVHQYGAGGLGGDSNNTLYAGGGGGGSMLSNFAKSLGFK